MTKTHSQSGSRLPVEQSRSGASNGISTAARLALLLVGVCVLLAGFATAQAESLPASVLHTALGGIDKQTHRLSDWKGKLRVVNFWATWCMPCRAEIPVLQSAADAFSQDGVEVIGVALDNAHDVQRFAQQAGIRYPLLLAEKQGAALMRSGGNTAGSLPYTLLVDAGGVVLQRHAGPIDAPLLNRWLQDGLSAPPKAH